MIILTDITIDYILRHSKNVLLRVNSLDADTFEDYIIFKRGRKGRRNYECGNMEKRMKKEFITWQKTDEKCKDGLEIWEIYEKPI